MSMDIDVLLRTLNACTERFRTLSHSDPTQYCRRDTSDVTKRQLVIYTAILSLLRSGAASKASSFDEARPSILERLPPKVLARVLKYLPLRCRIAASQTCTTVRRVTLATPELWTSVKIGPSVYGTYAKDSLADERAKDWTSFTAALSVITRSAGIGLPTRAYVSLAASCLQDNSSIACLHGLLRLVTTLRLEPYSQGTVQIMNWQGFNDVTESQDYVSTILPSAWRMVADALCALAPSLEFLEISAPKSHWVPISLRRDTSHQPKLYIPDDIFAGVAGQLRACYLDGFLIERVPAFSRLTSFDYRPNPDSISWTDIVRIIDQMPVLETLGLCGRFPSPTDDRELASLSLQLPPLRHQSLSRVALVTPSYCMDVMSRQGVDNVPCLLSLFRDACSRSDLRIITDFRSDRNAHVNTALFPAHVGVTIAHPRRILANHDVSILQDDTVMVLANPVHILDGFVRTSAGATIDLSSLVDLTIGDTLWPEFARLSVTAPQLKEIGISILLCSTADTNVRDVESIFTEAPWPAYPSLDFPALETFTISCTSRSDALGTGLCYAELMASVDQRPSSSFRCACRNGGVLSLAEVHALISNTIRLSAPLRALKLMGVRATFDADPVAAFLLAASIAEEVIVSKDVAQDVHYAEALWKQRYRDARFLPPSHSFHPLRTGTFSPDDDFFDHIGPMPPFC
ncbi:hypothetical protein EXIGLDRAFT_845786 [Exidia glandulosa HHB12029]|uniref:F-box domain-containing protein n=1 Tax=Exidia glandulosa HHB12029 TaxID=1314781 RepID=A0A165BAF1_EXIGL|nr:hypothetical protein EXIGLDRAFT_845786 [Exidia glandulosa HHB12029]